MFFSIIIPVYNNEEVLEATLTGIFNSDYKIFELILIDDGSSDNSLSIAGNFPCRIMSNEKNVGAATARNRGAEVAKGDILLFIDADVIVAADTLTRFCAALKDDAADAVVGVYGKGKSFSNPSSAYKNLFLHFSQDNDNARFWSGCAAIKKEEFCRCGGFDENIKGALVEDTAFGYALLNAGCKIQIRRDIHVLHNHRYTLAGLYKNEFSKTVEWVKLLMRHDTRIKTGGYYLNRSNFLSLMCVALSIVSILFSAILGFPFSFWLFFCFFVFFVALNSRFYALLVKEAGPKYILLGPLLNILSYVAAITGIIYAQISVFKTRR